MFHLGSCVGVAGCSGRASCEREQGYQTVWNVVLEREVERSGFSRVVGVRGGASSRGVAGGGRWLWWRLRNLRVEGRGGLCGKDQSPKVERKGVEE